MSAQAGMVGVSLAIVAAWTLTVKFSVVPTPLELVDVMPNE